MWSDYFGPKRMCMTVHSIGTTGYLRFGQIWSDLVIRVTLTSSEFQSKHINTVVNNIVVIGAQKLLKNCQTLVWQSSRSWNIVNNITVRRHQCIKQLWEYWRIMLKLYDLVFRNWNNALSQCTDAQLCLHGTTCSAELHQIHVAVMLCKLELGQYIKNTIDISPILIHWYRIGSLSISFWYIDMVSVTSEIAVIFRYFIIHFWLYNPNLKTDNCMTKFGNVIRR